MQATQSSTAAGKGRHVDEVHDDLGALREVKDVGRHLGVDAEETPRRRRASEGGDQSDLLGEAGELLRVLHLNGTLLVRPELRVGETEAMRAELRDLIERSWDLLERLLEFSHAQDRELDEAEGPVFLQGRMPSAGSEKKEWAVEEGAAGWIAC
jgi:hypothetical protein